MKNIAIGILIFGCASLSACSDNRNTSEPYTLYRNSAIAVNLGKTLRIHVATFDARETDPLYNHNNCEMSARLRNANVRAISSETEQEAGFWCEVGEYREEGPAPFSFDAEFPTETP